MPDNEQPSTTPTPPKSPPSRSTKGIFFYIFTTLFILGGITCFIIGIVNIILLRQADASAQLSTYGFYNEEIHILPDYIERERDGTLIAILGFFLILVGVAPSYFYKLYPSR